MHKLPRELAEGQTRVLAESDLEEVGEVRGDFAWRNRRIFGAEGLLARQILASRHLIIHSVLIRDCLSRMWWQVLPIATHCKMRECLRGMKPERSTGPCKLFDSKV